MKAAYFLNACATAGKRVHGIGDIDAGVIVGLDLEGLLSEKAKNCRRSFERGEESP
jgi:hypothetical protein